MMVKLYRVILPVSDIEQAEAFYRQLLDTPGQRVSRGRHYFDCGGTILACYDPVADGDDLAGGWRPHPNQNVYCPSALVKAMHFQCKTFSCNALR